MNAPRDDRDRPLQRLYLTVSEDFQFDLQIGFYTFMNFWIVNTEPMRPIVIPASVTSINTVPENVSNGTILIKLTPAISLSVI